MIVRGPKSKDKKVQSKRKNSIEKETKITE
jgi:hypothetical protein